jgi:PAS domain S-box-containing protein
VKSSSPTGARRHHAAELRNRNLELAQVNNDLSNLLSSTTLPVIMVDRSLRIRLVTSASARTMKVLPSDVGRPISDIRSDISIPNLEDLIREVIDTLATKELEVQDKDGCWYLLRIRPYRTLDDKIEGAVLLLTDINLMKTTSEQFKRAKELAEGIIDTVRQPLVVLDSKLRVISCNSAFFQDFKVSPAEADRQFFYRLGQEQWNISELREMLEKLANDYVAVSDFEVEHTLPDGRQRVMLLNARRIQGAPSQEPLILLAVEDITARKEGELALRRLASIVRSSDDAIISTDLDRVITTWNAGAERLFEYAEAEAVGQPISIIVPPELRTEEEQKIRKRVAAGEHIEHYDTVRRTKSGRRLDVSLTISPIRDVSGQVVGASKIARDISDRKQLDRLREQSLSQLESVVEERTLALRSLSSRLMHMQDDEHRRIARELHDSIGQYLAAIKMTLAQTDQADRQKAKAALSESQHLLDQCVTEVRTISYLLHPPLLDETGLASAAKWYVEGFGKRSNIQVQLEVSERIARLPNAVELALFRVLQESLTNVHRHSGSPKVDVHFDIEDGRVNLTVRDYGRGIPRERLDHFKNATGHLGVGLTGIRERINELGGKLQVLAEKPGTSIKATIPMKQDEIEAARKAASSGDGSSAK